MSQRWKFSNRYHEGDFEAGTIWMDPLSSTAGTDADSWKGTGSCIPPLHLRTAAARHWMLFFQAFWMASTWKREYGDVWREIVGKASELRVCIYVYMYICGCVRVCESRLFPDAVESLCVSGTNWTHTLLDGAADMYPVGKICNAQFFPQRKHCQAKPAPRDPRLLRSDFSSCLYLVIWLQHGGVQLCGLCFGSIWYPKLAGAVFQIPDPSQLFEASDDSTPGKLQIWEKCAWFCGVMWWLKLISKTIDWHMHSLRGAVGQSDYPSGAVRFAVDGRTLQVRQGQLGFRCTGQCTWVFFFIHFPSFSQWKRNTEIGIPRIT